MPVTNYYTVNGQIIGEKTTGSSRVDYLTDALGSVTATVNQSAQVVNTYRYKPSGAQLAKTGVGSDPANRWVGSQGYRQTGRQYSDVYVRARHVDTSTGRWTTKDPIGYDREVNFNFYHYVRNNPTTLIDPEGLQPMGPPLPVMGPPRPACIGNFVGCTRKVRVTADELCGKIFNFRYNPKLLDRINKCIKASTPYPCPSLTRGHIGYLMRMCAGSLKIECDGAPCFGPDAGCAETKAGSFCEIVLCSANIIGYPGLCKIGSDSCFGRNSDISGTLLHEMLHCAKIEHGVFGGFHSCTDIFACCILAVTQNQKDPEKCCERRWKRQIIDPWTGIGYPVPDI